MREKPELVLEPVPPVGDQKPRLDRIRIENRDRQGSVLRDDHSFLLDRGSGLPLYLQIAHEFVYRLEMGTMRAGDKLPSTRELARKLRVSFLTVDKAYKWLRARGLVASQHGVGWKAAVSLDSTDEEGRERVRILKFVDEMLSSAVEQGFDPMMIAQTVTHRAVVMERRIPARHLVFVECHPEYVDDYIAELHRELADLNVEIQGLLTTVLTGSRKAKTEHAKILGEADYVMTTLYHYDFVQRSLSSFKRKVVALSHTLNKEALYKIVSLPAHLRLGVLLGRVDPAPAIVRTLEFYRDLPAGSIPFAVIIDGNAVKKLKARTDVIAYTAACRDEVESVVGNEVATVLLRFVPDDNSIKKIRGLLGSPRLSENPIQNRMVEGASSMK